MEERIKKSRRLEIYKNSLKILKKRSRPFGLSSAEAGFCFLTYMASDFDETLILEDLPELIKYKPEKNYNGSSYWFNTDIFGTCKRRRILKRIIKEMK